MTLFGCSKFKKLVSEELDRELSREEQAFVQEHRFTCADCSEFQAQSSLALNFLRASAIDVDVNQTFDDRVIRKLRVQGTRESIQYWSPAVAGAFIAGLAVVAALQIITRSADMPHVQMPGGISRRVTIPKNSSGLNQNLHITLDK
jgi:hypothetical protein